MTLRPGHTLSHYRLVEKIGEGGMGTVYRARDDRLDREVAIKILHGLRGADAVERHRLIREARTAAKVQHANVAGIFEFDETNGQPFIVMELVSGQSLRQAMAGGPLEIEAALRIFRQICDGLGAAHAIGITHQDLKPENVAITASGVVKILDFGVARFRDPREAEEVRTLTRLPTLTQEGGFAGTIHYMAPELLTAGMSGPASDIFSLGVMLHEMLTGGRPFQAPSPIGVIDAILHAAPRSPSEERPGVTAHLDRVVLKCLSKSPADRYQSCDEITRALDSRASATLSRSSVRRVMLAVGLASLVGVVTFLALRRGERYDAVPGTAGKLLKVAIAPFSLVGTGEEERGRLVQKLVERELRSSTGEKATRVFEGALTQPILNEGEAREACHRLGADLVVWGEILEAGRDAEMEARLTLIRPLDSSAPFEALVGSQAGPLTAVIEDLSLDSPGELDALKLKATRVGSLVNTLAGLAQLRSGDFKGSIASFSTISKPTSDQLFYLGIALLRDGQVAEAETIFDRVIQAAPDHVGARLGQLSARVHSQQRPRSERVDDLLATQVATKRLDPRANLYLLSDVMAAAFHPGDPANRTVLESFGRHLERIACTPDAGQLPTSVLAIMTVTALNASSVRGGGLDPRLEHALGCPATINAFNEEPRFRLIACSTLAEMALGAGPAKVCQSWRPDPRELDPVIAVSFARESKDPGNVFDDAGSLERLAAQDPHRNERVLAWVSAMGAAERPDAEMLAWLDGIHDPPEARGDALVAKGMILLRQSRLEEADRLFAEAEAVLGHRDHLVRFRSVGLMASGRFVEAADYLNTQQVPERSLALAGAGRFSDAARALWPEETQEEAGSSARSMPSEAGAVMRNVYDEIQKRPVVRQALASLVAQRVRGAAGRLMFEYQLDYVLKGTELVENPDGSFELPVHWSSSVGPSLDFALPGDPLAVLHLLGEVGESAGAGGESMARREILEFSEGLTKALSLNQQTIPRP